MNNLYLYDIVHASDKFKFVLFADNKYFILKQTINLLNKLIFNTHSEYLSNTIQQTRYFKNKEYYFIDLFY